jgi:hypothetical protein
MWDPVFKPQHWKKRKRIHFCESKDTIKRVKRIHAEWETKFEKHVSDKGLCLEYIKNAYAQYLNRYFLQRGDTMANKQTKSCSISLTVREVCQNQNQICIRIATTWTIDKLARMCLLQNSLPQSSKNPILPSKSQASPTGRELTPWSGSPVHIQCMNLPVWKCTLWWMQCATHVPLGRKDRFPDADGVARRQLPTEPSLRVASSGKNCLAQSQTSFHAETTIQWLINAGQ